MISRVVTGDSCLLDLTDEFSNEFGSFQKSNSACKSKYKESEFTLFTLNSKTKYLKNPVQSKNDWIKYSLSM